LLGAVAYRRKKSQDETEELTEEMEAPKSAAVSTEEETGWTYPEDETPEPEPQIVEDTVQSEPLKPIPKATALPVVPREKSLDELLDELDD
jgi:hypothetical protein